MHQRTFRKLARGIAAAALILLTAVPAVAADAASAAKEKELIGVLQSGPKADKALACKQLAIYGGKDAVPELAKLLGDAELASWARIPLEVIPGAEADAALRTAAESLKGRLAVGTINSIGVRRDQKAVELLSKKLADQDAAVASAAAVALGRVGGAEATKLLRESLAIADTKVRSAVAEGCVLCAEQLIAAGKANEAASVYDDVRRADVVKQRKIEATRSAILARGDDGIPLLLEQLRSADKHYMNLGLTVARELPGRAVADALAAELGRATPDRTALVLSALADRKDAAVSPAVLAAAKTGAKTIRIAAIGLIGRAGDATSLSTLLDSATDADAEVSQAAVAAITGLPGAKVNDEIVARIADAEGKVLAVLVTSVGERRISATKALVKALEHDDAAIRRAALAALGETVAQGELKVLIAQAFAPKHADDGATARRALAAACVRMPDRDACAAELAAALPKASAASQAHVMSILGTMGGPKALETIAKAMKSGDDGVQDAGSKVLGEWLGVDAAPVLLDLAKTSTADKYKIRALRGYIRLARQYQMPDAQRAEMCQRALDAAARPEEQKLVLAVLERYPNVETVGVVIKAMQSPSLKDEATRSALVMGQKLVGKSADALAILEKAGIEPPKVEIVKAQYGAGTMQKDVTDAVRNHLAGALSGVKTLNYNQFFGGDPAPSTVKQLKIQYRINGKSGEATFTENAAISLPLPK